MLNVVVSIGTIVLSRVKTSSPFLYGAQFWARRFTFEIQCGSWEFDLVKTFCRIRHARWITTFWRHQNMSTDMRLARKLVGGGDWGMGGGGVIKNASIFCCFVAVTFPLLSAPLCLPQIHFIHICQLRSFITTTSHDLRHAPFVSHINAILNVICTRVCGKCFSNNINDPPEPLCFIPLCHTHTLLICYHIAGVAITWVANLDIVARASCP